MMDATPYHTIPQWRLWILHPHRWWKQNEAMHGEGTTRAKTQVLAGKGIGNQVKAGIYNQHSIDARINESMLKEIPIL
jgi:hypothetical protein